MEQETSSIGDRQFVTLGIGNEIFGIAVTAVRGILELRLIAACRNLTRHA